MTARSPISPAARLGPVPRVPAILAAIGTGRLAALAIALVAQHGFGIEPCPWCVIQRLVLIAVAAVALGGAAIARRAPRAAGGAAATALLALACGGLLAAWYPHTVAAKQFSCAFTWADRTLMALQLDAWLPALFRVGATCADAAKATLLGLPFEVWGGGWFAGVALGAVATLSAAARTPARRG
ncbi:MAG: disulfide bond formation protein B [Burkholderiales bacterium]